MNIPLASSIIISLLIVAPSALAQMSELERLSGFAQHQKNNNRFEIAREQGERAYLEEQDQWERQSQRDLLEYKKTKKPSRPDEEGPAARADADAKRSYERELEIAREKYLASKLREKALVREKYGLPSEAQELGLADDRPRYDYRKRANFGATPKYGKSTPPSSSGSSGGGYRGGGYDSSPSFPPPPVFDDGGYVPAPTIPDDFGDIPPPPPPPPPFGEEDYGGYNPDFPPPPPPPPMFDDGGDF